VLKQKGVKQGLGVLLYRSPTNSKSCEKIYII